MIVWNARCNSKVYRGKEIQTSDGVVIRTLYRNSFAVIKLNGFFSCKEICLYIIGRIWVCSIDFSTVFWTLYIHNTQWYKNKSLKYQGCQKFSDQFCLAAVYGVKKHVYVTSTMIVSLCNMSPVWWFIYPCNMSPEWWFITLCHMMWFFQVIFFEHYPPPKKKNWNP